MAAILYPPGFIKRLRERIARVIESHNAYEVPALCRRYGLAEGESSEAMNGKFKYAFRRVVELPNDRLLEIARTIAHDEGDDELLGIVAELDLDGASNQQFVRRAYFAERNGRGSAGGKLDLQTVKALFKSEFKLWNEAGYFDEFFGFFCVDQGFLPGKLGPDIEARLLFGLGKKGLWPVAHHADAYSEDDLFDMIEYLFDHVSKPLNGTMHSWSECGMHWDKFDQVKGRQEFRSKMNSVLARYGAGWEISSRGEILELAPTGADKLLDASLPDDSSDVGGRVKSAIKKFRQRQSTADDRRDAVRDLADVLEYLRPRAKRVLIKKDENAIFDIANNFGIRHHNAAQMTVYDPAIWLSWMFYFYLATIHAVVRLLERKADPA